MEQQIKEGTKQDFEYICNMRFFQYLSGIQTNKLSMKQLISIILLYPILLIAGTTKPISTEDFANWKRIVNRQISTDGTIVFYEINPQKGDGVLIIHNTTTNQIDSLKRGADARITADSKLLVYTIKTPSDTTRKHKIAKTKKELLPKDSIGIFNTQTREITKYPGFKSTACGIESNTVFLMMDPEKATKTEEKNDSTAKNTTKKPKINSSKGRELFDLVIVNSGTNTSKRFKRVESYGYATKADFAAIFAKENDSTKINTLIFYNALNSTADTLLRDSNFIKKITFDVKGTQFAFLNSKDTAKTKSYQLELYQINHKKFSTIANSETFSKNRLTPSENGQIYFSENGKKLFFGIAAKPVKEKKDSIPDDEKAKLDVWSYTDNQIQPKQLKNVENEKKKTFVAIYHSDSKKCIQLTDSAMESIRFLNKNNGDIAIGIDKTKYERSEAWDIDVPGDYFLVDVKTGTRSNLLTKGKLLSISPSGNFALWYNHDEKQYVLANTKNGQKTNPLPNFAFSLTDEDNDIPAAAKPYGITGWTPNDEYVLINDRYDIWCIDLKAKKPAINLTKGRKNKIQFSYIKTNYDEVFIPTNTAILLKSVNEKDFSEALHTLTIQQRSDPQVLTSENCSISDIIKARNTNDFLWSKQTVERYPEILYSKSDFKNPVQLSVTNPQQKEFNWATVEMTSWLSFDGDSLRGLLYKPANYDPTKKYPLMVYFYERNTENIHRHSIPSPSRSIINIPHYCSNGYLVFVPDITYKTGYPGQSAYNAIVSGVYHLISTHKSIDEKRMGLQGQSWGGYQTAYLITQTNIFAAAMAGAPVSNMTSAYGGIRWGTGNSRMFQYEQTQSRIGGTLWEKPLLYIDNSPLFFAPKVNTPLLIMANDNDGAVPWYQGIEYFMALYRLNKPVWMLNYNGMEHNIDEKYWANRMDLTIRMMDFFNHYLKGDKALDWMIKGIPATEKGK